MKKTFLTTISALVEIPYEEGLLDGDINRNHLMYLAQAKLDARGGFDAARAIYSTVLRELEDDGKVITETALK